LAFCFFLISPNNWYPWEIANFLEGTGVYQVSSRFLKKPWYFSLKYFCFIIFCFRDRTPRTPLLKSKHRVMLITMLNFFQKKIQLVLTVIKRGVRGVWCSKVISCFGTSRVEDLIFVKNLKTKKLPLWTNLVDTGRATAALWLQEFLIFERPLFLKSFFFFQKNRFQKWFIWIAKRNVLRFLEILKSGRRISHGVLIDLTAVF
jgi:hypothetical protein